MAKKNHKSKTGAGLAAKDLPMTARADRWYSRIAFWLVAALVFFPPLYRGLFFDSDMFVYHTITAVVLGLFWLDKINRGDYEFFKTPLDFIILGYVIIYALTNMVAVDRGIALYTSLRIVNYFMVYWLVYQALRDFKDYKNILRAVAFSGLTVAVIGILAAAGYIEYMGAFVQGRISSTFQYTNATGTFLAMAVLLTAVLWLLEAHIIWRCLYMTAGFVMAMVVAATYSKGSWLVFVLGILLFLVLLPRKAKFASTYFILWSLLPVLMLSSRFTQALRIAEDRPTAWLWLLPGIAIAIAGEFIWSWWQRWSARGSGKKAVIITAAILVLAVGVLGWWRLSSVQPEAANANKAKNPLLVRLEALADFGGSSYTSRMDIFRWGWEIFKDHPLLGTGGGGYNALYHQYQEYLHWTREAHNHYIQVLVEAGLLGLISFISIWGYLLSGLWRKGRTYPAAEADADNHALNIAISGTAAALYTLLLHAAIDFDLSLGAISVVLFTLGALLNWLLTGAEALPRLSFSRKALQIPVGVIFIGYLLFTGSGWRAAYGNYTQGNMLLNRAGQETDINMQGQLLLQSQQLLESAVLSDSRNGSYYADLALNYAVHYALTGDMRYNQQAKAALHQAEALAFYNIDSANKLFMAAGYLRDPELLTKRAEDFIDINPVDLNAYHTALHTRWQLAEAARQQGDLNSARQQAEGMLAISQRLEERIQMSDMTAKWGGAKLSFDDTVQNLIQQAEKLLQQ